MILRRKQKRLGNAKGSHPFGFMDPHMVFHLAFGARR